MSKDNFISGGSLATLIDPPSDGTTPTPVPDPSASVPAVSGKGNKMSEPVTAPEAATGIAPVTWQQKMGTLDFP